MARSEVVSEISGTVWRIEKREGDRVQKGDVLMLLESMKMEIPVSAPADGVLASLTVRETEPVEENQLLCVVEQ